MLGTRALLSSVGWTASATVVRAVAGLLGFIVMTQLLPPEAFGIGALLGSIIAICDAVVGHQVLESLVQRRALTAQHKTTSFWLFMAVAVLIFVAALFFAPWFARFYGEAELAYLLPLTMLAPLMSAATAVPYALLSREMRFVPLAITNATADAAGAVLGVLFASAGFGAISFVAMFVGAAAVRFVGCLSVAKWRPAFAFHVAAARDLFGFNMAVIGLRLVASAEQALPSLVVGRILGTLALGQFSVAKRVIELISEMIARPIETVALPVASKLQLSLEELREHYQSAVRFAAAIAGPVFFGILLTADLLVPMVLGAEWSGSVVAVQLLSLIGISAALGGINGATLRGTGHPGAALFSQVIRTILTAALVFLLSPYGIGGVAAGIGLAAYLHIPISVLILSRTVGVPMIDQLRPTFLPFLCTGVMVGTVLLLRSADFSGQPTLELTLAVICGVIIYLSAGLLVLKHTVRNVMIGRFG